MRRHWFEKKKKVTRAVYETRWLKAQRIATMHSPPDDSAAEAGWVRARRFDPDETEGRAAYRACADTLANIAMRRVTLANPHARATKSEDAG